jgi:hypothetical protein
MQHQYITHPNGNGNGNSESTPCALTAKERDHLRWLLHEIRPSGPDYLVEFRGRQFGADPDLAAAVVAWGGRICSSTYARRGVSR